jgi:hypothetical protein
VRKRRELEPGQEGGREEERRGRRGGLKAGSRRGGSEGLSSTIHISKVHQEDPSKPCVP